MRLSWDISRDYEEIGGRSVLREAVEEALDLLPPEHLRRLETIEVHDRDPKRKSLGIWRQDHTGCTIEIYVEPHLQDLLDAGRTRSAALLCASTWPRRFFTKSAIM